MVWDLRIGAKDIWLLFQDWGFGVEGWRFWAVACGLGASSWGCSALWGRAIFASLGGSLQKRMPKNKYSFLVPNTILSDPPLFVSNTKNRCRLSKKK